jgi:catechol 2,3-dioxygenase-like lactoylglutathione lyase family enzyme
MHSRVLACAFFAAFTAAAVAQLPDKPPARPRITGISHLAIYASDMAATDKFYREVAGAAKLPDPENPQGVRYALSATQFIEVLPLPADAGINRLDHTAWNTEDAEGLRRYLGSKAWKVPPSVKKGADGTIWFDVKDSEGNTAEFVQLPSPLQPVDAPQAIGHHIIHVGLLVHSRSIEDIFYRDLLGFRPYWYGGRQDGEVDWVSQQVPDGHDWLEYMLVHAPSGTATSAGVTQRALGGMDHLSIGEQSVPATYKLLTAANRMVGNVTAEPKMGRDGKYQLNLFDPDGTRLEVMDFHATEKPCCSPFTASDPQN